MRTLTSTSSSAISRESPLTVLVLAGLTSLILALVPGLTILNVPFRLLLTMVHELGHGLAALLTGGSFRNFIISWDGSGLAYTSGGWRLLIVPAGYLGTALFGVVLILLSRSSRASRNALLVLGALLLLLTLRYGTPSVFSGHWFKGLLTVVAGIIFGSLLIWVSRRASSGLALFLLDVLAIQAVLTAFSDILGLIGISSRFFNTPPNDARSMEELTYIPAIVWAVIWAVIATLLVIIAIWSTWLRPGATASRR